MVKKRDIDIWKKIQNGDKTAFEEVYQMYIDSLYNYGSSLTSDSQLIEDAVQEMFINIWTKRSTISIHSNIKGYLFTSLRRQILAQIDTKKKTLLTADFKDKTFYEKTQLLSPDRRLDQVKKEISKLSRREREAVVLKYQEGMSYDDISTLMNLKNQAIYKLVSRGLKKIKSNIKSSSLLFF